MGVDRRTPCQRDATQEDRLCDTCRCPHGGCDHHGDDATYHPMTFYDDPMDWIRWFAAAHVEMEQCLGRQNQEKMLEEELHSEGS